MRSASGKVLAAALAGTLALLVGCGGDDEATPSSDATTTLAATTTSRPTPTSIETTTTNPAVTTLPTIVVTLPPTSTTQIVATLPPTTLTDATSTTVAGSVSGPAPPTAFVTDDTRLLEVDVASGSIVRVVAEDFTGEGLFRGALRMSPDRTTIWFSEGYEDSWFACDSSIGSYGRVDLASGGITLDGIGNNVEPSPDGALVTFTTSKLCLPDPENPEFWVLTPSDRAVLRDLTGGVPREFVTATPPNGYDSPDLVRWAGFRADGDLVVLMGDGRLYAVDPDGSTTIQDHPLLLPAVAGFPVAALGGALITTELGDEGSSDLVAVDLATGATSPLASSEGFMSVGVSAGGHLAAASPLPITVEPGAPVTVIDLGDDVFVYDLDW